MNMKLPYEWTKREYTKYINTIDSDKISNNHNLGKIRSPFEDISGTTS